MSLALTHIPVQVINTELGNSYYPCVPVEIKAVYVRRARMYDLMYSGVRILRHAVWITVKSVTV